MAHPPQTLSVKRKRNHQPVDALIVEHSVKRHKVVLPNDKPRASPGRGFYFRRLTKPNDAPQQSPAPPTPTAERRFHLDGSAGSGTQRVVVEERPAVPPGGASLNGLAQLTVSERVSRSTSPQRKRPGAGSALRPSATRKAQQQPRSVEPSEHDVRELEALSERLEKEDNLHIPLPPTSKHKPKAPAQRFADRHPDKATTLASQEPSSDAMDIEMDEYVYDTYVREPIIPDAEGKMFQPTGTVGLLVISAEDEELWNAEDESDREFDTDEDDENAEDHYANDYPEDELSEDDEFGRNTYQQKYRRGSDDEEYVLNRDDEIIASDEDEDDLHFKMTVPKAQKAGYWGAYGE